MDPNCNEEDIEDPKATKAIIEILRTRLPERPRRILVVGCGSGREARMLAQAFGADTIGIDLATEFKFDNAGSAPARLMVMDARNLEFEDTSFDLVYSYHVLEHIVPGSELALSEMARVLRPEGAFVVGTPNRLRMIGYFGVPVRYHVWWNVADMWMRLTGRWTNEAGAHAGFSENDLCERCASAFGQAEPITDTYYQTLYRNRAHLVDVLIKSGLKTVIYPSVYVFGIKK